MANSVVTEMEPQHLRSLKEQSKLYWQQPSASSNLFGKRCKEAHLSILPAITLWQRLTYHIGQNWPQLFVLRSFSQKHKHGALSCLQKLFIQIIYQDRCYTHRARDAQAHHATCRHVVIWGLAQILLYPLLYLYMKRRTLDTGFPLLSLVVFS